MLVGIEACARAPLVRELKALGTRCASASLREAYVKRQKNERVGGDLRSSTRANMRLSHQTPSSRAV